MTMNYELAMSAAREYAELQRTAGPCAATINIADAIDNWVGYWVWDDAKQRHRMSWPVEIARAAGDMSRYRGDRQAVVV